MPGIPPRTAAALADHVNELLGPPDAIAGRVGLLRLRTDGFDIDLVGAFNSIPNELPLLPQESADGAFLSASATCARLGTELVDDHPGASERVRVTFAVTMRESAIVLAAEGWSLRGECAIHHPVLAELRKWAGL